MKILIHWVVSAVAIIVSAYVLPGVHVDGLLTALILAVVLGAINGLLRPALVVLTFPLTLATFGLFLFVLNTLLVMLAAWLVPGFSVASFWWALVFGIVLTLVNSFLHGITKTD